MRAVQYRLLTKLFNTVVIPEYIYAFEKFKSIPEMAKIHTGKALVISIDLKDFFPSIHQNKLQKILVGMGIAEEPATTISELCTYKFFVPQGALTSPKVANIVTAHTFGPKVKEYCDRSNFTVSIYADDITISTDNTEISPAEVIKDIYAIIRENGFRVNKEKTKVMFKSVRQYVCGVVVNEKTNLLKRERNKLRAMVHNVVTNGVEAEAEKNQVPPGTFLSSLKGKLNWYRQLNPTKGEILEKKLNDYLTSLASPSIPEEPKELIATVPEVTTAVFEEAPWD